jgi:hypothetical protein
LINGLIIKKLTSGVDTQSLKLNRIVKRTYRVKSLVNTVRVLTLQLQNFAHHSSMQTRNNSFSGPGPEEESNESVESSVIAFRKVGLPALASELPCFRGLGALPCTDRS